MNPKQHEEESWDDYQDRLDAWADYMRDREWEEQADRKETSVEGVQLREGV